jgi:hypothetical protein
MKVDLEINHNERGYWVELSNGIVSIVMQKHYASEAEALNATRIIVRMLKNIQVDSDE